jgi:DNA polymerase III epsilon subunit-like protein
MLKRALIFDTETTDLVDFSKDYGDLSAPFPEIVAIAWKLENSAVTKYRVAKTRNPSTPGALKVHKISFAQTEKMGSPIVDILREFMRDVANAELLVGYNVRFDRWAIRRALVENGMLEELEVLEKKKFRCLMQKTMAMPQWEAFTFAKTPTLGELCRYLQIDIEDSKAHNAAYDVYLAESVLMVMRRVCRQAAASDHQEKNLTDDSQHSSQTNPYKRLRRPRLRGQSPPSDSPAKEKHQKSQNPYKRPKKPSAGSNAKEKGKPEKRDHT